MRAQCTISGDTRKFKVTFVPGGRALRAQKAIRGISGALHCKDIVQHHGVACRCKSTVTQRLDVATVLTVALGPPSQVSTKQIFSYLPNMGISNNFHH